MAEQTVNKPKLSELFCIFAHVSAITIGGGYVMFPLMKREVVDTRGWITDEEMVDYYALGQSIPGIIAMNTATLVGYRKRGIPGAICSAAGMAAPSILAILAIVLFLMPWIDHPLVQQAFFGIRAAVVAIMLMAVWQVGSKSARSLPKALIAVGAFAAITALHLHPVILIIAGGLLGWVLFRKGDQR